MTPGMYIRKRRRAAGLQVPEVARCYAHHKLGAASVEILLGEAEADITPLGSSSIHRLAEIFSIDAELYLDLVEGWDIEACRDCACSEHAPCFTEAGPCAWADAGHTICTACAPRARVLHDHAGEGLPA